ncbi:gamma-glutamylcyclotransferase-like [Oculina patagonica]
MSVIRLRNHFTSVFTRILKGSLSPKAANFNPTLFCRNFNASMTAKEMYFAFGSNMNPNRMNDRKAFFTERVGAKLSDYKMSFSFRRVDGCGSGNIRPEKNSVVHGVLYTLEAGGLEKLDVFEMVSKGCYRREMVTVETSDGIKLEATTYVVTDEFYQEGLVPRRDYLEHCLAGKDVLPTEYYDHLESFKKVCKDMDSNL